MDSREFVAKAASDVIPFIAAAEIYTDANANYTNGWPNLLPGLLALGGPEAANPMTKRFAIETIGSICEVVVPEVLSTFANDILTVIIAALSDNVPANAPIRIAA